MALETNSTVAAFVRMRVGPPRVLTNAATNKLVVVVLMTVLEELHGTLVLLSFFAGGKGA
jgi:hypothetical protein